jgi:superfamily II DNA or RNA helicase
METAGFSANSRGTRGAHGRVVAVRVQFDRGTLILDAALAGAVFDERTRNHRASAHRYRDVRDAARVDGVALDDRLGAHWRARSTSWSHVPLRSYQSEALSAWMDAMWGTIVLPTGSGKTHIALAAAAALRAPTVILCPTRVLLAQWVDAIRAFYGGPVGVVGDGEHTVEDVTVMTFESAYRKMDAIGDRFALLVVDEAHHFAAGVRGEALEACAAPYRLGLTATAPDAGSEGEAMLADLVGATVFEKSIGDLTGEHLAPFDVVRLRVALDREERNRYVKLARPFLQMKYELRLGDPRIDWDSMVRVMAKTPAGRRALSGWHRAVALATFPAEKRLLASRLVDRHTGDRTLVFAALAEDARTISRDNLVPAITADTRRAERDEILARFRDGEVRCVVSARVLNEGVDVPEANVAVLLGASLGVREQIQRIGRVLRPRPGKRAVVYDVATSHTIDADRSDRKWRRLAAQTLSPIHA